MFYLKILPKEQKEIFQDLLPITQKGFILFGGTAIALQLGHRVSVDFDFFRSLPLNQIEKSKILKLWKDYEIFQDQEDALVINVSGVKISFFGGIDFVNLCEGKEFQTLKIANLKDLLSTKLAVLTQRIEYKDYTDIANILKSNHVSLKEGLIRAKEFYHNQFSIQETLKTMNYFEGGDLHRLQQVEKDILIKEVQKLVMKK
ncbi:nucleotidyl transferase AbiEii/AbiGii toxin family protein [Helicobacter sp. 13S00477-4]|uniref:nucleotidyl transferase AbiEii/AbiGii toxin family protein n=1 Tax=Helicobacter sp. 13S00477-4 TaxID=1905759 RepID=UPI000BA7BE38|nr:nucleotidyl transferase AbiEii/AbiGii toxin family protein [Helicobacter sp. 13S00477-4]PAF52008.1 hypothetical protein BKH44_04940 [Helicobacter sp. 13S00477-4]